MKMTGAQALIEGLLREGVSHIFGYAGATNLITGVAVQKGGGKI